MPEEHRFTNRLINEKSPYLLQHAHNPVNWYPWSEEAFEESRENDKPIFLSIGYATCHWCHVMEHECFDNEEIANRLNETFICIKVDREELPEVDALYMEFAQSLMVGAAGWPLNVILTPGLQPFFAATFLPPDRRQGMMSIYDLIDRIQTVWKGEERERVEEQAEKIVEIFEETTYVSGDEIPDIHHPQLAAELYFKLADSQYGGLKGAPKFPIGYQGSFLLTYSGISKDSRAVFLVERTLDSMYQGGIYDHIGGGFSRYSIDETWLVPHFEKMLYDNALLIQSYAHGWQISRKPIYQKVIKEIVSYIFRSLTDPKGGFYSAEDADTEGKEGYFYTWTYEEVQNILPPENSQLFCEFYGITKEGNFEGRNILHMEDSLVDFADEKHMDKDELKELIDEQRQLLFEAREKRTHPFIDDKILSSWNGLMIHSLVLAGMTLDKNEYVDQAEKAAQFIKKHLWKEQRLLRRWRDGDASFTGCLDEYAFMIRGLITLFEADRGVEWLQWALELTDILHRDFKAEGGAFFQTDGQDPNLLLRKVHYSDGAEPSGNAIHCENLLRLYQMTGEKKFLYQAEDILKAVKRFIENYSPGYIYHLNNIMRYYDKKSPTMVISLNKEEKWRDELFQFIHHRYLPHLSVIVRREGDEELFKLLPYVKDQKPLDGETTLYLCHEGVCKKPLNDLDEILTMIREL